MKRFLAIVRHPIVYFWFKRNQEQMLLLHSSCSVLKIDEPTVWDVDKIYTQFNVLLKAIHENKNLFKTTPFVKKHLFWTIFLSRFTTLSISRESAKRIIDEFNFTIKTLPNETSNITGVVTSYIQMVNLFHVFV